MSVSIITSREPHAPSPSRSPVVPTRRMGPHRYEVGELIARGGMAAVYRATDLVTRGHVAIKRLLDTGDRQSVAMFQREFHVLRELRHPRIIEVYEYGVDEQGPYYSMELLDGEDLRRLAPMAPTESCALLRDVASSLGLLHARRLLHRDVTPRNVRRVSGGHCKLLDFGAMTPFGFPERIVGTPPFIPPETMRGAPLDQRADLFSLGAVAYWLLTGRHAFPAHDIPQLLRVWERSPEPISKLATGVPEALEDLVMSLLSGDPLARPTTAAEVINRLDAILGDPLRDEGQVAASYLYTPALVGRRVEMAEVGRIFDGSTGAACVIEGRTGSGKTRVLSEAVLRAALRGTPVLTVDALGRRGPYQVARTLALAALRAVPVEAVETAKPHATILLQVVPELVDHLPEASGAPQAAEASDARAQIQTALRSWFCALAERVPLVLAIDDLQGADEPSLALLAVLASLATSYPLFIFATHNRDATQVASAPLRLFLRSARRLELAAFDVAETTEFLRSLFSDAPNTDVLARKLHETASGYPLHCLAAARHLVVTGVVRYSAGMWLIPLEIPSEDLPRELELFFGRALMNLRSSARTVAERLSVAESGVSLQVAQACCPHVARAEMNVVLRELESEHILVKVGDSYQFAHESVRKALLNRLGDVERRSAHLAMGNALLEAGGNENAEIGLS